MAGLDPAICARTMPASCWSHRMPGGWVYIMTNRPGGTLYSGVTSDLVRRITEHRDGTGRRFVRRYYLKRLVYAEPHDDMRTAIQRETSLKRWPRAWKVALIAARNPEWNDLASQIM